MLASRLFRGLLLASLLAVAVLSGCSSTETNGVTSAWPQADSERAVPRPADLVRWPLTGVPADGADTTVRAVSVKIENSAASRPQSSLSMADVVYESLTEGSITRFNAIFHSQAPETVGPVRSARQSDVYVVPQYDALFAHVGGNSQVISNVRNAPIDDLDQFAHPGPYWRSSSRPRPHNMYTSIPQIRELGATRGFDEGASIPQFLYELLPEEAQATISRVTIPFAPGNSVRWDYDSETRTYARFHGTTPHTDAVSGEQITARNVVVLWARHSTLSKRDVTGSATLDIQLTGNGRCSVFRGGQRFDGTWETDGSRPPLFTADDGTPIRLAQGNTWMQVVRTDTNITME
jgi:hypothetical protein